MTSQATHQTAQMEWAQLHSDSAAQPLHSIVSQWLPHLSKHGAKMATACMPCTMLFAAVWYMTERSKRASAKRPRSNNFHASEPIPGPQEHVPRTDMALPNHYSQLACSCVLTLAQTHALGVRNRVPGHVGRVLGCLSLSLNTLRPVGLYETA